MQFGLLVTLELFGLISAHQLDTSFNPIEKELLVNEKEYLRIQREVSEDAKLQVPELIAKYGYPVEVHHVESQNGYILEMHRIPYGLAENAGPKPDKPVVFVQHGILCSSADWIIAGPKKSLAYLLADLGYDVWLGNARGNTYSKKHKTLSSTSKVFWNFSWHEIGVYDLPAMIDYALEKTGQNKTFYIGHSQGTTVFFVMCTEKPEMNSKIRAQFSMAPIAYMNHVTNPLFQFFSLFHSTLTILSKILGINEFLPSSGFLASIGHKLCSESSITQFICTNSLFVIGGFNVKQMNTKLLPTIMSHTPAGASTKQLLHYAQLIRSGKFRQYDFGWFKNLKAYGSIYPPNYSLKNVTAPVALHYSHNDWLAAEVDVFRLYEQLENPIGLYLVPDRYFNHVDYLWGRDADTLVYNTVFSLMTRY